tara:strand:- start:1386 stop:1961 length:576 start_codon:yes stop_codon:yes gene_type:complete
MESEERMQGPGEFTGHSMSNDMQLMNPTFLQLRLDTRDMIKDFEYFLSAKRSFVEMQNGVPVEIERTIGKPLANQEGITAILNMVLLRAHHHCVQGNFKEEHYWENMCKVRKEVAGHIIMNCHEWGIEDSKLNYIIDTLMDFLEKVGSRTIDNKERESYMSQFLSKEQIIAGHEKKDGALQRFAGGFRRGA